jgi:hypothetical protein
MYAKEPPLQDPDRRDQCCPDISVCRHMQTDMCVVGFYAPSRLFCSRDLNCWWRQNHDLPVSLNHSTSLAFNLNQCLNFSFLLNFSFIINFQLFAKTGQRKENAGPHGIRTREYSHYEILQHSKVTSNRGNFINHKICACVLLFNTSVHEIR